MHVHIIYLYLGIWLMINLLLKTRIVSFIFTSPDTGRQSHCCRYTEDRVWIPLWGWSQRVALQLALGTFGRRGLQIQVLLLIYQLTVTSIKMDYPSCKNWGQVKSTWNCKWARFLDVWAIPGRRWLEIRRATSLSFLRGVSRFRHLGETDSDCLQESRKCAVCPRSVWKLGGASGPKVVSEEAHVEHPL